MSTATYTIDATHFTPPAPPVRTPRISRIAKAEWTKLRTLPSTWRTVVMAIVISIALGAILCVSQVQQWSTMTAATAPDVRPDRLFPLRCRLRRRRAARGTRGAGRDCRVRDGDDPVHLHRHAHQTAGTGSQGCGHCGVCVPRGAAGCRGQLRGRPAGLRRQAPRSVLRSSRRPPSGGLRCPGGEPYCRHRGRDSAASSDTPRQRPRHWCWSSWEASRSASCFRPAFASTCPGPHSRPPSRSTTRRDS